MPSPGSCIQESIRSLRMSPLPHLHKVSLNCMYSCLPQDHVSRNPSVYRRISSLPHLPKVSLNCMYSCLAQVHVSRNPSARSGCLPFPTYPRSASTACILALLRFMYPGIHPLAPDVSPSPLTQGQPQQQPSSSSCIQESIRSLRMSSLPHFPKVGGAFPGSVSPGVHLCHLSGLPSPLPQSQRCLPRISVSRSPLVSPEWTPFPTSSESAVFLLSLGSCIQESIRLPPDVSPSPLTQGQPQLHVFMPSPGSCIQESIRSLRMSPLPHLHKVSLNCMYSCLPQDHVSRNPSVYRRISSLPHLPKVSLNCMYSCLAQVHVSRNPSARSGCLPFPTYPRSASTTTFLKFMYPGIHPLAPDVFPSPFP
nr:uncharacterized protein LOC128705348 isoform X2 [Cherax quadricarinatus]